jgi:hypothetical protein
MVACENCRRAKRKCDGVIPSCSPCMLQGRPCVYPEPRSKRKRADDDDAAPTPPPRHGADHRADSDAQRSIQDANKVLPALETTCRMFLDVFHTKIDPSFGLCFSSSDSKPRSQAAVVFRRLATLALAARCAGYNEMSLGFLKKARQASAHVIDEFSFDSACGFALLAVNSASADVRAARHYAKIGASILANMDRGKSYGNLGMMLRGLRCAFGAYPDDPEEQDALAKELTAARDSFVGDVTLMPPHRVLLFVEVVICQARSQINVASAALMQAFGSLALTDASRAHFLSFRAKAPDILDAVGKAEAAFAAAGGRIPVVTQFYFSIVLYVQRALVYRFAAETARAVDAAQRGLGIFLTLPLNEYAYTPFYMVMAMAAFGKAFMEARLVDALAEVVNVLTSLKFFHPIAQPYLDEMQKFLSSAPPVVLNSLSDSSGARSGMGGGGLDDGFSTPTFGPPVEDDDGALLLSDSSEGGYEIDDTEIFNLLNE